MDDDTKQRGPLPEGESRAMQPERGTRPQPEKERAPDYFNREQEKSGRSEWSGGSMGGGVWAGRKSHDRER